MGTDHIVTSYDKDLNFLNDQIYHMGKLTESQLDKAIQAVLSGDLNLAQAVIDGDQELNKLEHQIDHLAVQMIALRQPVAGDLRAVISALKISSHLERMADYARNMSKGAFSLSKANYNWSDPQLILQMSDFVKKMTQDVVQAYIVRNLDEAMRVWNADDKVDELYLKFLKTTLKAMAAEPENATAYTQLLFIAKNLERTGDHAKSIAEIIHYLVTGLPFQENEETV